MTKTKRLNYVTQYGNTGYFLNDLGEAKSPRFELYHEPTAKSILKTNNPYEANEWMKKHIWKEVYDALEKEEEIEETSNPATRGRKKAAKS